MKRRRKVPVSDPVKEWDGIALSSSGKFTMDEIKTYLAQPEMEAFDRLPKYIRDKLNRRGGKALDIARDARDARGMMP